MSQSKIWTTIEELRHQPEYGWYERTRGMDCPGGVLLIVETLQSDEGHTTTSSAFAPGLTVADLRAGRIGSGPAPVNEGQSEASQSNADKVQEFRFLVRSAMNRHPGYGDAICASHVAIEIAEQGDWYSAASIMALVLDGLLWRGADISEWDELCKFVYAQMSGSR